MTLEKYSKNFKSVGTGRFEGMPVPDGIADYTPVKPRRKSAFERFLGPQGTEALNMAGNAAWGLSMGDDYMFAGRGADRMVAADNWTDRLGGASDLLAGSLAFAIPGLTASYFDDATEAGIKAVAGSRPAQAVDDAVTWVDRHGRRLYRDESGAIRVWHGSPHDFEKFRMDKIGTGEGAQAYGDGLYLAENKNVGVGYADDLSSVNARSAQRILDKHGGDTDAAIEEVRGEINRLLSIPDAGGDAKFRDGLVQLQERKLTTLRGFRETGDFSKGHLYEVNINANPEDFLDYDAPLSEQPQIIRDMIDSRAPPTTENARIFDEKLSKDGTGEDIYDYMLNGYDDPAGASSSLRDAGIPGIKYYDQGSRAAGEGSRNYVVFDDDLLDILSKDGTRTPAQEVARLLREDPTQVTDDMLNAFGPNDHMEISRLYESGATGMDLPMDEASRLARLDEHWPKDGYHGTDVDIHSFDPKRYGQNDQGWWGRGVTTDTDPEIASAYANYNEAEIGQNVIPVSIRGRHMQIDNSAEPASNLKEAVERTNAIKDLGYDGSAFTNDRDLYGNAEDWGTERVTFDPVNIRSRFARGDPRLKHLANLSAGVAGGAFTLEQLLAEKERRKGLQQ